MVKATLHGNYIIYLLERRKWSEREFINIMEGRRKRGIGYLCVQKMGVSQEWIGNALTRNR